MCCSATKQKDNIRGFLLPGGRDACRRVAVPNPIPPWTSFKRKSHEYAEWNPQGSPDCPHGRLAPVDTPTESRTEKRLSDLIRDEDRRMTALDPGLELRRRVCPSGE